MIEKRGEKADPRGKDYVFLGGVASQGQERTREDKRGGVKNTVTWSAARSKIIGACVADLQWVGSLEDRLVVWKTNDLGKRTTIFTWGLGVRVLCPVLFKGISGGAIGEGRSAGRALQRRGGHLTNQLKTQENEKDVS